jgi:hypothetical protein
VAFTGHCLWILHFTKKELSDYDFNQLTTVVVSTMGTSLVARDWEPMVEIPGFP